VFPLASTTDAEPGYLMLDEALKGGHSRVTEVSLGGNVPELLFDNSSKSHVPLLDGDELVGAKQNRVLNITILVGPGRKLTIPVSCVERGRWHSRSAEFRSEDRMMFARGRAAKMAQVSRSMRTEGSHMSDQGAVWQEVANKSALFQAVAPTEAMSDVYAHVASDIRDFRAAFHAQPRSYALDAIEHPRRAAPAPDVGTAQAFLAKSGRREGRGREGHRRGRGRPARGCGARRGGPGRRWPGDPPLGARGPGVGRSGREREHPGASGRTPADVQVMRHVLERQARAPFEPAPL
jgi:hypothetical protein